MLSVLTGVERDLPYPMFNDSSLGSDGFPQKQDCPEVWHEDIIMQLTDSALIHLP